MDVTGDRSKIQCCKEQYCIGTWNVRSMNQGKEVENNRMGKTRDIFKKIRDTKGICHTKMSSIKGRNGIDLIETEDIKERWQEYMEELYKKRSSQPR